METKAIFVCFSISACQNDFRGKLYSLPTHGHAAELVSIGGKGTRGALTNAAQKHDNLTDTRQRFNHKKRIQRPKLAFQRFAIHSEINASGDSIESHSLEIVSRGIEDHEYMSQEHEKKSEDPNTNSQGSDALETRGDKELHSLNLVLAQHDALSSSYQKAMLHAEEKLVAFSSKIKILDTILDGWNATCEILENETAYSRQALQMNLEELIHAITLIESLENESLKNKVANKEKDAQIGVLQDDLRSTKQLLDARSQSLHLAEIQISELTSQVGNLEKALKAEEDSSSRALRSLSLQTEAAELAKKKLQDMTSEVASLKSILESKEELITSLRDENRRTSSLLIEAAKSHDALKVAEQKIEHLSAHVDSLEGEIEMRDNLLNEIKEEALQTTEALKLAAKIKQELNIHKEKELQLSQELESKEQILKELSQEILENSRAVRAESMVRQLEKSMHEVNMELEILRKGIQARDEAIKLMKDELDRNIEVLNQASGTRQLIRSLEDQLETLQEEMTRKDAMLAKVGFSLSDNLLIS